MKNAATVLCLGIVLSGGSCLSSGHADEVLKAYAAAATAWDSGDYTAALSLAGSCLAMDHRFLPALMIRGKSLFLLGDDELAIDTLSKAIVETPRAGQAALWLARAYRAHGDASRAERTCQRALQADPANIEVLRLASMLALDAGDAQASLAYLDRSIESAAEAGLAFVDRAALRWAAGDGLGASTDLDAAMAILPPCSSASAAARATASKVRTMMQGSAR